MKFIIYALFFSLLVGCASAPTPSTPERDAFEPDAPASGQPRAVRIDMNQLERSLAMQRSEEELGYEEKSFDSCSVGAGFSSTGNCRTLYFGSLNYRLQCRDTEGTISYAVTAADLRAIAGRNIKWNIRNKSGTSQTDNFGYGQVREVFDKSAKRDRVKLSSGNEMLYMRANEIKSIIVPRSWCN